MKKSIVKEKALDFAMMSVDLYKQLLQVNEYVLSKQFIKSATSIGANINEALAGQSKKDFIAKMSISSKEAREVYYWIELLEYGKFINHDYSNIKSKAEELIKMLTSIVKTGQENLPPKTKN